MHDRRAMTRRQALTVIAGAGATAALASSRGQAKTPAVERHGQALGGQAHIVIRHRNEAVPADSLEQHVADLAKELASLAPGSMSMGLAAYVKQDAMDFDSALPYLRTQIDACLQSPDAAELAT